MKILEAQNAVLSNFEVHKHVAEQSARYKQKKRRPPPNSATIMREVSPPVLSTPNRQLFDAFEPGVHC
jgi:hypothetical protein